jgi:sugar diacid utilization regulator
MPGGRAAVLAAEAASPLVESHVRDFVAEDRARGGVLTATIRAFAEAELDLCVAAERLEIHPHRAHHRLTRIAEGTGRNPRRIEELLDLLVAIELGD